ncbi:MAG: substrate-binding domain-containing protein [Candidatus Pelethousia sp.]|nr:substrate-binding domain-containing protein [Candidatus Pelethousia sp.]
MKKFVALLVAVAMMFTLVACAAPAAAPAEEAVPAEESAPAEEAVPVEEAAPAVEVGEATMFEQACADLDKLLAPLPEMPASDTKLAALISNLSNSFWVTMKEGYEDTAKEYGVSIDVMATESDTDTEGQLQLLNDLLVQDYSAVALSPLSLVNLISGIVAANEANVGVIAVGNGVDAEALAAAGGSISAFVTSDFKAQGTTCGEYIAANTAAGKALVVEGTPGATQSDARRDGAKEALEAAGFEVTVVTANFDAQTAYDQAAAYFAANPDAVACACGNDDMALGVVRALKDAEMKDSVMVVGIDCTQEARDSIAAGELNASLAMSPYLYGRAGVITMLKVMQGLEVPETVWSPEVLVTAENLDLMSDWR